MYLKNNWQCEQSEEELNAQYKEEYKLQVFVDTGNRENRNLTQAMRTKTTELNHVKIRVLYI